ncbi:hypothetical protein BST61_g9596 [Cercospora zeina]
MLPISNFKPPLSGIVSESRTHHPEPKSGPLAPLQPIAFAAPMYAGCAVYTQPGRPSYSPKVGKTKRPKETQTQRKAPTTLQRLPKTLCLRQPVSEADLESGFQDSSDSDSKSEDDGVLKGEEDRGESEETQWERIKSFFFTCPIPFVILALAKMHEPRNLIARYRRYAGGEADD